VNTNFARGAPYSIWQAKKCPKFNTILTTFDFDREYLRNGSAYQKSEKHLCDAQGLSVYSKNLIQHGDPKNKNFF